MIRGLVVAALAVAAGYVLADSYVSRLSDHRGFSLVAVDDAVAVPPAARARRAVFVLVDGLRADAAEDLRSVARLRAAGARCLPTRVSLPTVSRPVYAMYSSGVEQDRTGSRNNDEASPLAVESIWQVAREAGRRVEGVSELPWWQELFPDGFDAYTVVPMAESVFVTPPSAELSLYHPVYVDEEAHLHGAASAAYTGAVARVDGELEAFLGGVDLSRDLVVLTADHGHTARGGHGGAQPEVAEVLTCFAGRGVRPAPASGAAAEPTLRADALGPTLAALLGLRFPRHMRASPAPGEDGLDLVFALADPAVLGEAYLADRRAAVERFRAGNAAALAAWSDGEVKSWRGWYARGERAQMWRAVFAALVLVLVVARLLGGRPWGERAFALLFVAATLCAMPMAYAAISGGLDSTSLNRRTLFIRTCFLGSGTALLVLGALHAAARRSLGALVADLELLVVVLAGVNLGHIVVFGWPLGFPVPPRYLYFMPFLSSVFLLLAGGALGAVTLGRRWRERRREPTR